MPFSWYHTDIPAALNERQRSRATEMFEREIAERAGLLFRLGYTAEETQERVQQTVDWDFEINPMPNRLARVEAIVGAVFERRGEGTGTPSV